jgi:hypothetical protein
MSIPNSERTKMLRVALCGPRVIRRLEAIGVQNLDELADRDPEELVLAINHCVGAPIWHPPMATRAMTNLITEAQRLRRGRSKSPAAARSCPP